MLPLTGAPGANGAGPVPLAAGSVSSGVVRASVPAAMVEDADPDTMQRPATAPRARFIPACTLRADREEPALRAPSGLPRNRCRSLPARNPGPFMAVCMPSLLSSCRCLVSSSSSKAPTDDRVPRSPRRRTRRRNRHDEKSWATGMRSAKTRPKRMRHRTTRATRTGRGSSPRRPPHPSSSCRSDAPPATVARRWR
jgi:hypothetical protein